MYHFNFCKTYDSIRKPWLEIQQRQTKHWITFKLHIKSDFIQAKDFCESQKDFHWSYKTCECVKRSLVERGAGEEPKTYNNCGDYFSLLARRGNSILDIGGWVLLGSCLALVAILAGATYHYRWSTISYKIFAFFLWVSGSVCLWAIFNFNSWK